MALIYVTTELKLFCLRAVLLLRSVSRGIFSDAGLFLDLSVVQNSLYCVKMLFTVPVSAVWDDVSSDYDERVDF